VAPFFSGRGVYTWVLSPEIYVRGTVGGSGWKSQAIGRKVRRTCTCTNLWAYCFRKLLVRMIEPEITTNWAKHAYVELKCDKRDKVCYWFTTVLHTSILGTAWALATMHMCMYSYTQRCWNCNSSTPACTNTKLFKSSVVYVNELRNDEFRCYTTIFVQNSCAGYWHRLYNFFWRTWYTVWRHLTPVCLGDYCEVGIIHNATIFCHIGILFCWLFIVE